MEKIKIITAIANPILNNELRKDNEIQVVGQDIQYQEGIFEILEINKNNEIKYIVISEKLPGKLELNEVVDKIKIIHKEINIIIILESEKEELENLLYSKGIFKIIYNNKIKIDEIIDLIKTNRKDSNYELKLEIEKLKKIIIENNQEKTKEENNLKENENIKIKNKSKFLKKFKLIKNKTVKNDKKEIISISGTSGVGKSIISVNLAKAISYDKRKVLIIDFDILNNSLHTILGVKKYPHQVNKGINERNINYFITKINRRIDLISATEILFDLNRKLNIIEFQKQISKLKEIYDVIIIDTSSECFLDYTKNIIKISNKNIFVLEANIVEIKKAKNLLNIYLNEWKIEKDKFNILFNKYNKESINLNLLKKLFSEFNIIGTLQYNSNYNKLINKNIKNNFYDKRIRKDYLNIKNKI